MTTNPSTIADRLMKARAILDALLPDVLANLPCNMRNGEPPTRKDVDEAIDCILSAIDRFREPIPSLASGLVIGQAPPPMEQKAVHLPIGYPVGVLNVALAEGWSVLHTIGGDSIAILVREKRA